MLKEIWKIRNGDSLQDYYIFSCDHCGNDIEEAWPFTKDAGKHFCVPCSFIRGYITESKYLDYAGGIGWIKNIHAAVHEGKVYTWVGHTAPWEPTLKQLRATPEYRAWRKEVMKKGKGKCKKCKSTENLEAHHKKSFAKFSDLRFEVSNGEVLCSTCHDLKHAKKKPKPKSPKGKR